MTKILIIGSGGRENALAWKFAQDPRVEKIYVAPGNGGSHFLAKVENIPLKAVGDLCDFARDHAIDLTMVGSEELLVEGIVDRFQREGLLIFGPNAATAQLEGSKRYAKDFMKKYGVKTAAYASFDELEPALAYLAHCPYPTVVKASGLAAGKGVVICPDRSKAEETVRAMMEQKRFGCAGEEIVIEEFLEGFECSILSFCDGKTLALMGTARDHKTIGEHGQGENTGGMGVVAPHPLFTAEHLAAFRRDIGEPTLRGLAAEGLALAGVIFFGLMVNGRGVYLLEYNMRLGDPETQALLPLMENQLLDPILETLTGLLQEDAFKFRSGHAVCLVAAAKGYPGKYEINKEIKGLEQAKFFAQLFIAGAKMENGKLYTSGGRVLNVVAQGPTVAAARQSAYSALDKISFAGLTYRRDIGED